MSSLLINEYCIVLYCIEFTNVASAKTIVNAVAAIVDVGRWASHLMLPTMVVEMQMI